MLSVLRPCAGVKLSILGHMCYFCFSVVLNSLMYLHSIPVVNFSQKCHFDAIKILVNNQPTLNCASLFQSVFKNVNFPTLATDISSTETASSRIPFSSALPPLALYDLFFVEFRITSAQLHHFHTRELHDNFLIRSRDV